MASPFDNLRGPFGLPHPSMFGHPMGGLGQTGGVGGSPQGGFLGVPQTPQQQALAQLDRMAGIKGPIMGRGFVTPGMRDPNYYQNMASALLGPMAGWSAGRQANMAARGGQYAAAPLFGQSQYDLLKDTPLQQQNPLLRLLLQQFAQLHPAAQPVAPPPPAVVPPPPAPDVIPPPPPAPVIPPPDPLPPLEYHY